MWILSLFPDFLVHTLLLVGIAGVVLGFLFGFIPFISTYKLPIQIVSIILLVFSVYLEGGIAEKEKIAIEMANLKAKLAQAEAKAATVNTEIVTKIVTKQKIIREKGATVTEYIDTSVAKYNDKCAIPQELIKAHNAAAQNKAINELNDAAKPPLKLGPAK